MFFKKNYTFLLYGSEGWIGGMFNMFMNENHPEIKVICGTSRIDNSNDIHIEMCIHKPTHVISFTGRTHGTIDGKLINTIDYLEYPGKLVENIRDNLYGPLLLSDICKRKNIHYTYLGTGCIFNSKNEFEKFDENSIPNYFGSSYSVVKGFTDRLINNCLNLRIRMPICSVPNSRNFITKITGYQYICSQQNSMTILDDFFPIFVDLIKKKKIGKYNCTNPGTIDHNEILSMYRDIVDPTFTWNNMTIQEQSKVLKSERSNNHLDTKKISSKYPNLKDIRVSMKDILIDYATSLKARSVQ